MLEVLFTLFILIMSFSTLGLIAALVISSSNQRRLEESERAWVRSIKTSHQLPSIVYNQTTAVAFNISTKRIGVFQRNGDGYLLNADHLAAVEFKSEYMNFTSGIGETTTNRGSQLVSAGVGAAVAGPVGMLAGALSGSTQTQTHSSTQRVLTSASLQIRFFSDDMPVVAMATSMVDEARQLAARFANIIDLRTSIPSDLPPAQFVHTNMLTTAGITASEEFAATTAPERIAAATPPESVRRGWWQRTFGE